ncbi:DUF4169 family protein [Roseiarcus sp.]|uniref:DUF4169 family protein n=1 Tax=Roseiarcus sp. TaxID=1969460 RepID=UPI003F9CE70E
MGDLVNLRQARKRREREREASAAAENRAVHGMTRAERQKAEREREKAARSLDSHKLDRSDDA